MEGKINHGGWLEIKRGTEFKQQDCPFNPISSRPEYSEGIYCSDWCPLFGQPVASFYITSHDGIVKPDVGCKWYLDVCQGRKLTFDNFTDERITE